MRQLQKGFTLIELMIVVAIIGILERMGLGELVAAGGEDYVDIAVRLARDGDYRDQVRRRIQSGRHVLYRDAAPIRALEEFLQSACYTDSR